MEGVTLDMIRQTISNLGGLNIPGVAGIDTGGVGDDLSRLVNVEGFDAFDESGLGFGIFEQQQQQQQQDQYWNTRLFEDGQMGDGTSHGDPYGLNMFVC